jgi:GDP-L-fucose synthase
MKKNNNKLIFIAGHNGMLGRSLYKKLKERGYVNIVVKNRKDLDLIDQKKVMKFFSKKKIEQVYLCAGKVGGIMSNQTFPADFIYENLQISLNVINASKNYGVKKLLFIGSSCVYPKKTSIPIKEKYLLSSELEKSNEPYAISKIAGIKICESFNRQFNKDFRVVMPSNLYGEGDTYDSFNSHVIPALILKFHKAKIKKQNLIKLWGTGNAMREFLYIGDMANFCIKIMNLPKNKILEYIKPQQSHINLGSGVGTTIKKLATIVANVVGFKGKIVFDPKYPDGHPKKINDITIQKKLGLYPRMDLISGISIAYKDFLKNF